MSRNRVLRKVIARSLAPQKSGLRHSAEPVGALGSGRELRRIVADELKKRPKLSVALGYAKEGGKGMVVGQEAGALAGGGAGYATSDTDASPYERTIRTAVGATVGDALGKAAGAGAMIALHRRRRRKGLTEKARK